MAIVFLASSKTLAQIGVPELALIADVFLEMIPSRQAEVELELISSDEMRMRNLSERNLDQTTDVLSFPLYESFSDIVPGEMPLLLGSISICPKEAELRQEGLPQLVVHGMLHLLGKDHETKIEDWLLSEHSVLQKLTAQGLSVAGIETW